MINMIKLGATLTHMLQGLGNVETRQLQHTVQIRIYCNSVHCFDLQEGNFPLRPVYILDIRHKKGWHDSQDACIAFIINRLMSIKQKEGKQS